MWTAVPLPLSLAPGNCTVHLLKQGIKYDTSMKWDVRKGEAIFSRPTQETTHLITSIYTRVINSSVASTLKTRDPWTESSQARS